MRAVTTDPQGVSAVPAPARRHLLAVWNPVVGADAMEQHLRVLQDAARKFRHKKARADEVYVWWGKLRSVRRLQPLPHLDEILKIETETSRDDEGPETHLYLADYASLYVAHMGEAPLGQHALPAVSQVGALGIAWAAFEKVMEQHPGQRVRKHMRRSGLAPAGDLPSCWHD